MTHAGTILMALACGLLGSVAHAEEYNLPLADSINLAIDYTSDYTPINDVGGPAGTFATKTSFNVSGAGISENDKISVVFINYSEYFEESTQNPREPYEVSNQTVVLTYDSAANKFTGEATKPIVIGPIHGAEEIKYYQEAAVVINGNWYKAPSGTNFRFTLMN